MVAGLLSRLAVVVPKQAIDKRSDCLLVAALDAALVRVHALTSFDLTARNSATAQPIKVQPKNRLSTNTDARRPLLAMSDGAKYSATSNDMEIMLVLY
jgi:hypothetical protein